MARPTSDRASQQENQRDRLGPHCLHIHIHMTWLDSLSFKLFLALSHLFHSPFLSIILPFLSISFSRFLCRSVFLNPSISVFKIFNFHFLFPPYFFQAIFHFLSLMLILLGQMPHTDTVVPPVISVPKPVTWQDRIPSLSLFLSLFLSTQISLSWQTSSQLLWPSSFPPHIANTDTNGYWRAQRQGVQSSDSEFSMTSQTAFFTV